MDLWNNSRSRSSFSSHTASYIPTKCRRESQMPKFRITRSFSARWSRSGTRLAMVGTSSWSSILSMDRAQLAISAAWLENSAKAVLLLSRRAES